MSSCYINSHLPILSSACHQNDGNGAGGIDKMHKSRSPSNYQPLAVSTMEKDRQYCRLKVAERRGKKRDGLRPTEVNLAIDEQLYEIPTM